MPESNQPLRRSPAIVPTTTPRTASNANAISDSAIVTGNAWAMSSMTG